MSKKITLLSTSMLLCIASFSQKNTLQNNELDPVVVTANKMEQKQSTTGKVITIINKETINKNAGKTIAQILNDQAGITINGALNNLGSVQTVYMRGAASGRTLILLDGIPVNDPSMINNEFDLNLFSLTDVERIEICKGAQSTLYGSDAIAGVINIITAKKNISKPVNLTASSSGGIFDTWKGNMQLYGKIGKLTYTTRYSKIISQGFSSAYDSTGKNNFDKDGYNGNNLNATIQYQATEKLSVKTYALYSDYTTGADAGPFTDKTNFDIFNKNFTTGLSFTLKEKKYSITGNYQYNSLNRNYNDNASVIGANAYSLNNYNSIAQFAEVYSSINLGKGFSLLAGTDYRYGSMNNQYNSVSTWGPYKSSFNDTGFYQNSLYSSLYYTHRHFTLELGGRYNHHSRYGNNYTYTFNPSYTINTHFRIFGSIASGFKAPSLYQLYDSYSGNIHLQPEKSVNYEIGVEHKNQLLTQRLVFFYRNINNGIDFNYVAYQYFNYIQEKAAGIEYELSIHPTKQLTITTNYTFLTSKQITESRVSFNDTTYNYALRRPKHSINVTAGYQFTPTIYVSANAKYVSRRYDIGGYQLPDVALDSYLLLGVYAEYDTKKYFKLYINLQNITNKKFFDINGYNSIPFMYTIGAAIKL